MHHAKNMINKSTAITEEFHNIINRATGIQPLEAEFPSLPKKAEALSSKHLRINDKLKNRVKKTLNSSKLEYLYFTKKHVEWCSLLKC